jgi:hypothetical protein
MNNEKNKKTIKNEYEKACQKCGETIGGKAYNLINVECIYDGKSLSACETLVLCSQCYSSLKSWLHLRV